MPLLAPGRMAPAFFDRAGHLAAARRIGGGF